MNYMKKILSEMKERPGMYLYECNLENLYAFMNEYMYRIFQNEDIIPEFYPGFQEYIEKVYNIETGQHWTKILNFFADDEKETFTQFYIHLEEFTKINENNKI